MAHGNTILAQVLTSLSRPPIARCWRQCTARDASAGGSAGGAHSAPRPWPSSQAAIACGLASASWPPKPAPALPST
jgi:hypothetical protein